MCGGKKFSEFQVDCLEAHNDYRSRHGAPPLELSLKLCKYAEEHAKFLCQCDLEKSVEGPYGENILIKRSQRKVYPDAYEPVMQWYAEAEKFNENTTYPSEDIKHFSQLVLKETKTLGVGFARNSAKNKIYIVATYFPKGNNYDTFVQNVSPIDSVTKKDRPSTVKIV